MSEEFDGSTALVVLAWYIGGAVTAAVIERDAGIVMIAILALGIYSVVTAELAEG